MEHIETWRWLVAYGILVFMFAVCGYNWYISHKWQKEDDKKNDID